MERRRRGLDPASVMVQVWKPENGRACMGEARGI